MELYTSLTRLKMSMNDGRMPPMTPLSERARQYLDPAFTPGMGCLEENEKQGLRCPVRECGLWFLVLGRHLNTLHLELGGRLGVLDLLGIPPTVSTASSQSRARFSEKAKARWRAGVHRVPAARRRTAEIERARAAAFSHSARSITKLNLLNACESQVTTKMLDLQHTLGREPTWSDAERQYGSGFIKDAQRVFGSWANLRGHMGMRVRRQGMTPDEVYDSFKAYWDAHGCLPTAEMANDPTRTPLVPRYRTVLKILGAKSWTLAMQQVAFSLELPDKRYSALWRETANV